MIKNIIFTADKHYLDKCYVTLKSILAFNRKDIKFHIISPKSENTPIKDPLITNFFQQLREDISDPNLTNISFQQYFYAVDDEIAKANKFIGHLNESVYLRFAIPFLELTGKALYLDCDLVITGSLDELFATDMQNASIAVVAETVSRCNWYYGGEIKKHCVVNKVFNAGVMLIDMDIVTGVKYGERHNWTKEFFNYEYKKFKLHDQDFLNIHYIDDIYFLSHVYNFSPQQLYWDTLVAQTIDKLSSANYAKRIHVAHNAENTCPFELDELVYPIILHWNGALKPWDDRVCIDLEVIWMYFDVLSLRDLVSKPLTEHDKRIRKYYKLVYNPANLTLPYTQMNNYILAFEYYYGNYSYMHEKNDTVVITNKKNKKVRVMNPKFLDVNLDLLPNLKTRLTYTIKAKEANVADKDYLFDIHAGLKLAHEYEMGNIRIEDLPEFLQILVRDIEINYIEEATEASSEQL